MLSNIPFPIHMHNRLGAADPVVICIGEDKGVLETMGHNETTDF